MRRARSGLTTSNVLALVALFVALGGTTYAIKKASVGTKQLKANAVNTAKLSDDAVTGGQLVESTLGAVPAAAKAPPPANGRLQLGTVVTVTDSAPLPANPGSAEASVQCPSGARLIGGGGGDDEVDGILVASENAKEEPNGWHYAVLTTTGSTSKIDVEAYCLVN